MVGVPGLVTASVRRQKTIDELAVGSEGTRQPKASTNADDGFGVDGEVERLFSGGFDDPPLGFVEGVGREKAAQGRGDNGLESLLVNGKGGG